MISSRRSREKCCNSPAAVRPGFFFSPSLPFLLPSLRFHLICSLSFAPSSHPSSGSVYAWEHVLMEENGVWLKGATSEEAGVFKTSHRAAGSEALNGKIDKMTHRGRRVWKSSEWKRNRKKRKREINAGQMQHPLSGESALQTQEKGEDRTNRC